MLRSTRILLLCLIALTQMIAPLVHAHVGGGHTQGQLHVPGLEFLNQPDSPQMTEQGGRESFALIVYLSQGLASSDDQSLLPSPSAPEALPSDIPMVQAVVANDAKPATFTDSFVSRRVGFPLLARAPPNSSR